MIYHFIAVFDFLIWMSVALSALYVVFFAFASRLYKSNPTNSSAIHDKGKQEIDFLILIPAYAEDAVICQTVQNMLQLQYPRNQFHVTVISDHQQLSTNQWLSEHVDTLLIPRFQNSSKAKALQYAIQRNTYKAQYVLVLDADNIVEPTFLGQLCDICTNMSEKSVVQCHRQAKNHQTPVALLDAISEEINNAVFRSGHNSVGLPAALIGSGMCFPYQWFSEAVHLLETAGEDKELELLLLKQNYHILFAEHIAVYDEKVSNSEVFHKQRSRWITAQVQCLLSGIKELPQSIIYKNIGLIDKTLQQLLIPRSLLLLICLVGCVVSSFCCITCSIKWWIVLILLMFSLWIVIPSQYKTRQLFHAVLSFPVLCYGMILGMLKIDRHNKDFTHTSHGVK